MTKKIKVRKVERYWQVQLHSHVSYYVHSYHTEWDTAYGVADAIARAPEDFDPSPIWH